MSIRTFIAIEIPPHLKQIAADLQNDLKSRFNCRISWTKTSGMHLTLKFLGDTPFDLIDPLAEAVDSSLWGIPHFDLSLTRPGSFGGKSPRVLWIGLTCPDLLLRLQKALESAAEPLGFPPKKRRFHPHLTLGRVKDPAGTKELLEYFNKINHHGLSHSRPHTTKDENDCSRMSSNSIFKINPQSTEFPVDRISLYKSDLKPSGAEYTVLKIFHLSK